MGQTVAITGANSYFASTVLPLLFADDAVEKIVGIDVTPQRADHPKFKFVQMDVRDKGIASVLKGCDTVYHLAFVVAERHDKEQTNDININGSKTIFEACVKNQVKKVIYTSSATAYGAHRENPLSITEERPLKPNPDSYYSSGKALVEAFSQEFFAKHPEIVFTILRAGLCAGPNINNMFSDFWSRKASIFISGRDPYIQLIHEGDLGEALYLAHKIDIPGVYNVAASDALATRWVFAKAGVTLVRLPARILKTIANIAFALRLEKVSQGWLSLSEYTIHISSDKFKKATGWQPKWTSEATFLDYLAARKEKAKGKKA